MRSDRKLPRCKSVIRTDAIVAYCRGKHVLNVGMGGWLDDDGKNHAYLTQDALEDSIHYRIGQDALSLTGTDIIADSLERMNQLIPGKYVLADITQEEFAGQFAERFDLVVFAEVIEHLDNFKAALANIRAVLSPGGQMLLTTANAYAADRIAKMLFNYEACHEEHTSYFSYLTIRRLLAMNGWRISHFDFHTERPFRGSKRSRFALYYAMRGITAVFPQFSEGILILAEPA